MNPARKRQVRLVVSLTVAVLLASGLIYTSFSAADPALTPSQLERQAQPGVTYVLSGTVLDGTVHYMANGVLDFRLADRANGRISVPVVYTGAVPDPFREGREVIVTVRKSGAVYDSVPGSLITKCPSKYSPESTGKSA
jgi:cytochrome c-type biogenesis protein CcmE